MVIVMGKESRRLGRGLNSLISSTVLQAECTRPPTTGEIVNNVTKLGGTDSSPTAVAERAEPHEPSGPDEAAAGADASDSASPDRDQSAESEGSAAATATMDAGVRKTGGTGEHGSFRARGSAQDDTHDLDTAGSANTGQRSPLSEVRGESVQGLSVPVERLVAGKNQPRTSFSAASIGALARSIAQSGVIQPLVVRRLGSRGDGSVDSFEIIAGERRWRAAKAAGLNEVPVVVRELDDQEALEIALIENLQREDLNAIDRAEGYESYCRRFGLVAEDLARRLGEDRSTVVNYLRLLELPEELKGWVAVGKISMGHARSLLGVDAADGQMALARAAVANGWSVRQLEEAVRHRKAGKVDAGGSGGGRSVGIPGKRPLIADLEGRLEQAVGTKVRIKEGRKKGTGRITIEYYGLDDFERITGLLGMEVEGRE